jgi:hypothetical protein
VAMYCHLATDAHGLMHVLIPDVVTLGECGPATGLSPLARATA